MGNLGSDAILVRSKAALLRVISLCEVHCDDPYVRKLRVRALRSARQTVRSLRRADLADSEDEASEEMADAARMAFESAYWLSLIRDADAPGGQIAAAEDKVEAIRRACHRFHPRRHL